jgi:hypothetical protein
VVERSPEEKIARIHLCTEIYQSFNQLRMPVKCGMVHLIYYIRTYIHIYTYHTHTHTHT